MHVFPTITGAGSWGAAAYTAIDLSKRYITAVGDKLRAHLVAHELHILWGEWQRSDIRIAPFLLALLEW